MTWDEHGDRVVRVKHYRCLACGAAELVRRDWFRRHEKDKAVPGRRKPADGRLFVARPLDEDEEVDE